jgi:hypothetical protein
MSDLTFLIKKLIFFYFLMEKTSDLTFLIKKLIFFYFFNEKTFDPTFLTKKLMFYSVRSSSNPSNSVQVKFII